MTDSQVVVVGDGRGAALTEALCRALGLRVARLADAAELRETVRRSRPLAVVAEGEADVEAGLPLVRLGGNPAADVNAVMATLARAGRGTGQLRMMAV